MTSNYKMKSLLKGLRYISHMFENEKEPEMQIGTPTDVKHVAHIGWDGGSLNNNNSPTWMNDFEPLGGYSSSPRTNIKDDASYISEGSSRSCNRPGVPRWSRERSSHLGGLPTKEQSRRGSNSNPKSSRRLKKSSDNNPEDDGLRKSRRNVNGGGSARSSQRSSRAGSQTKSIS